MPKLTCQCGAKYRFAETAIGKKAKCKKCGTILTIEAEDQGPIPIADEPDWGDEVGAAAEHGERTGPRQGDLYIPPNAPAAMAMASAPTAPAVPSSATARTYTSDVLWTFLFPASPSNLVSFLVVWVLMTLAPLVGCVPLVGWFLSLLVLGWYCAYRFEVLSRAAAGESDIPDISGTESFGVGLLGPLCKWIGSWAIVLLPALLFAGWQWRQGQISGVQMAQLLTGGLSGLTQGIAIQVALFFILVAVGLFFWPMVALCIALGGFSALSRIDLIVVTIAKTFPVYLLTILLMFGAVALQHVLTGVVGAKLTPQTVQSTGAAFGTTLVLGIIIRGLEVYFDIVLMRLVGLYYYHFKGRFAWSWE